MTNSYQKLFFAYVVRKYTFKRKNSYMFHRSLSCIVKYRSTEISKSQYQNHFGVKLDSILAKFELLGLVTLYGLTGSVICCLQSDATTRFCIQNGKGYQSWNSTCW